MSNHSLDAAWSALAQDLPSCWAQLLASLHVAAVTVISPGCPLSSRIASAFSDAATAASAAGDRRAVNQLQGCRHVPAT